MEDTKYTEEELTLMDTFAAVALPTILEKVITNEKDLWYQKGKEPPERLEHVAYCCLNVAKALISWRRITHSGN